LLQATEKPFTFSFAAVPWHHLATVKKSNLFDLAEPSDRGWQQLYKVVMN
jgi:hypothetical protein